MTFIEGRKSLINNKCKCLKHLRHTRKVLIKVLQKHILGNKSTNTQRDRTENLPERYKRKKLKQEYPTKIGKKYRKLVMDVYKKDILQTHYRQYRHSKDNAENSQPHYSTHIHINSLNQIKAHIGT